MEKCAYNFNKNRLHGSLAECQLSIRRDACSSLGQTITFKLLPIRGAHVLEYDFCRKCAKSIGKICKKHESGGVFD
jgi:hypothetical protein